MKPNKSSEPKVIVATTVLLMLLSISSMLAVGLVSSFQSTVPSHRATSTLSHPVRSSHGAQLGALRGRITRWVAYFVRSG